MLMDEVVGHMEAMVVQALVQVMTPVLVLVIVDLEDCMVVEEAMVAVVATILMPDRFMPKLCPRSCSHKHHNL